MMTPANTVAALALLLLTQSLCAFTVSTGFICPNLSYLDSSVQLICTGGSIAHKYTNPRGVDVAQCPLIKDRPCTPANAPASVISSTQTVFNVTAVTTTDAGTWLCEIGVNVVETCNLTVAKTPTCSITSQEGTDVLAQYQELTLTVDIQDYYCSTALTFSLQTGNVTTLLIEAASVASATHNTFSETLNVTDSHLGIVGLLFSCNNSQWNLICDGVTELKTPTCSISSDKDTDRLALNEALTLTVDNIGYNCPVGSNFTLQTGNVLLLNVSGAGAGIDRATLTFHVTKIHLGGVRLIFNCQHKHWNLTCDGVTELIDKTKTISTQRSDGQDPLITVAGAVSAIVFFNIIVITIVIVVKRHQMTRSADTPTHDGLVVTVSQGIRKVAVVYPPSGETVHQSEDNVVVGSGGSASGNDEQGPGLRINPAYVPTTVGDRIVTTGSGVMGGDNLQPEMRGEYVGLDRTAVQPSNIYEQLKTYEQIPNM